VIANAAPIVENKTIARVAVAVAGIGKASITMISNKRALLVAALWKPIVYCICRQTLKPSLFRYLAAEIHSEQLFFSSNFGRRRKSNPHNSEFLHMISNS